MIEERLSAAAFGGEPGCWPLPAARTPYQLWLRAVAAGGQGRYSIARADLAALLRATPDGRLASLAHSTHASFLRQLGWHTLARGWDGRALALAEADSEACVDALIGLAADALGVGRLAASAALLRRVADMPAPRLAVRHAWVSAELAMASGDGANAVRHAERAAELAMLPVAGQASARHRAKSEVVLAAAWCSAGATDRARAIAEAALETTTRLRLVPLRWALACLLADIGSASHPPQQARELRDACADWIRRAGGTWPRR